jgi:acyl-CoA reductase-like NAD-dependent aldehyde dehydrogenase
MVTYPMATPQEVQQAVATAKERQALWQAVPLKKRCQWVRLVGGVLADNAETFAKVVATEMGKPLEQGMMTDVLTAATTLRTLAELAPKVLQTQRRFDIKQALIMGMMSEVRQQPWGVVGVITPWNYPLATPASALAAALLAGNTVVWKPSDLTPACSLGLYSLFDKATEVCGLPCQPIQLLLGDGQVGQTLLEQNLPMVFFTGSSEVGRHIHQHQAKQGNAATLECGGNDPAIALAGLSPDDLKIAVQQVGWSRLANAGQTCAATKRLYVPQAELDTWLAELKAFWLSVRVGHPFDPETHVGPLASHAQLARLQAQLKQAEAHGDTLWRMPLPHEGCEAGGAFVAPVLALPANAQSPLLQQEVFGPVLSVVPYTGLDELVASLNAEQWGLGAMVLGDPEAVKQAMPTLDQLQVGQWAVNMSPVLNYAQATLPWVGRRASGHGVRNGAEGLLAMTQPQVVSRAWRGLASAPWLFGKTGTPFELTSHFVQWLGGGMANPLFLASFLATKRPESRL